MCIDIFSKRAEVVVLKGTSSDEALRALKLCIETMGPPRQLYVDRGSEFKSDFDKFCKEPNIILTTTIAYARFAERFVRWVKLQLFKRREAFAKTSWTTQMVDITNKWNSMDHKGINMNAKKPTVIGMHWM